MPETITATITLNADELTELMRRRPADRQTAMVDQYGEACSKTQAAKIISVTPPTINAMLADGRVLYACGGTRVDVRSLARYIDDPGQADHAARMRKKGRSAFV